MDGSCLVAVLRHLDAAPHHLAAAAQASSTLREAAGRAQGSIHATLLRSPERLDALLLYLERHGQHVRSLEVSRSSGPMLLRALPSSVTQLRSLKVEDMQLQPGLGDGHACVLQALPQLAALALSDCTLLDASGAGALGALSVLPGLQELHYKDLVTADQPNARLELPGGVLAVLSRLTAVSSCSRSTRPDAVAADAALQHLGRLTGLQDLQLGDTAAEQCCYTAAALQGLTGATGLTRLPLARTGIVLSPTTTPGLAQATALQHLDVYTCGALDPALLAGMSQLRVLKFQASRLDEGLSCASSAGSATLESRRQVVAALLAAAIQLTRLRELWLNMGYGGVHAPAQPPAAYAALTASSELQVLSLGRWQLPEAAFEHMFPASAGAAAGRLSALTRLHLSL